MDRPEPTRSLPSGWAVRYRVDGAPKKLTLGSYPAVDLATARKRAQEAIGEVAGGVDPAARKMAAREACRAEESINDRVADVVAQYVERYVKRPAAGRAWAREVERLLKVEVVPVIGAKRLGELSRSDINALLDGIVDRRGTPYTANRTLAVLRRMCNWAIERVIIANSPVEKIKPHDGEKERDRVLSDDEIRLAWRAFNSVGQEFSAGKSLFRPGAANMRAGSHSRDCPVLCVRDLTLLDVRGPTLAIVCQPCVMQTLADCPKTASSSVHDRCKAVFEGLTAV